MAAERGRRGAGRNRGTGRYTLDREGKGWFSAYFSSRLTMPNPSANFSWRCGRSHVAWRSVPASPLVTSPSRLVPPWLVAVSAGSERVVGRGPFRMARDEPLSMTVTGRRCRARMCAMERRPASFLDNLVVVIGILKECRRGAVSSGSPEAFSQGSRAISRG